ncbi:MAG TPA: hypothetical protein VEA40_06765 [Ramlibacter sp.]|nr:hypothetical protein [Ramlibacter sp.]
MRSSTIPSLPVGARVRISPCSIRADIGGQPALGRSVDTAVVIVLGDRTSRPVRLPVSISESGVVTVGNTQIGRANLTRVTGATGATGGAGG